MEVEETCATTPPTEGELLVQRWTCGEQTPASGEGTVGDLVLANAWMRVVLRQPTHALTVPGIGGGGLVDVAPWGLRDVVHEAIPLVGGGALELDAYEVLDDGLRLSGRVQALPGRDSPGGEAEITWRLDPDAPVLYLDGADGLWLNPQSSQRWADGALDGPDVTVLFDGDLAEDLGGARILTEVTALDVRPTATRWAEDPLGIPISGTAANATRLELAQAGTVLASWTLTDGVFEGWAPPGTDAVRATAPSRAPSAWTPPGEDLTLTVGEPGELRIDGPGPMSVRWTAEARGAYAVVEPGTVLEVGAGDIDVTVDGVGQVVAVPANGQIAVSGTGRDLREHWVSVDLDLRGSRDFRSATSSFGQLLISWYEGASFGLLLAEQDVADPTDSGMAFATGSRMAWDGWTVDAFPWVGNRRQAAHGALDPSLVPLDDVLAAMRGGPGTDRSTVVDLAFLEARGELAPLDVHPDGVRLTHPLGNPLVTWAPWFAMEAPARPVGPVTWAWMADASVVGTLEVQRALAREQTVAGSGPLITLSVDGELDHAPLPDAIYEVEVDWEGSLDEVRLFDGERELARWDGVSRPWQIQADADRLVVVGWSLAGDWATTTMRDRLPVED